MFILQLIQLNMIFLLKEVGERLGRTPTMLELTSYNLPCGSTYGRNFGSYSEACLLAGLDINYNLMGHGKTKIIFSSRGDKCYSVSELIITEFFICKNIDYKKEGLYKNYIIDERCGNKRVDWVFPDGTFIEFFGFPNHDHYKKNMENKILICKDNKIKLIEIYNTDLNKLESIFSTYIDLSKIRNE